MKVQATRMGFYDNQRKKEGEVFDIKDKAELGSWMQSLESSKDAKALAEVAELHKKQATETFNAQPRPGKSSPSRFFSPAATKPAVTKKDVKAEAKPEVKTEVKASVAADKKADSK